MQSNISSESFMIWSAIAKVLGYLLHQYPDRHLIENFQQQKIALTWPVLEASEREKIALVELNDVLEKWDGDEQSLIKLQLDFGQLFFGPEEPKAAPWGSVYLCESQILFDRSTAILKKFYKKYSIRFECKTHEPVDHIGLILTTLAYLFDELSQNVDDTYKLNASIELLKEHLLPWAGKCLYLAQINAKTVFYRSIASLAIIYLHQISEALGVIVVQRKLYR